MKCPTCEHDLSSPPASELAAIAERVTLVSTLRAALAEAVAALEDARISLRFSGKAMAAGHVGRVAERARAVLSSKPTREMCEQMQLALASVDVARNSGRVVGAYLLDHAERYANDSCCRHAVCDAASHVLRGEVTAAHAHGELDDLLARRQERSP